MRVGRAVRKSGPHSERHNVRVIGLCLVGTEKYSRGQWASLVDLVHTPTQEFPKASILGHRNLSRGADSDGAVAPDEDTQPRRVRGGITHSLGVLATAVPPIPQTSCHTDESRAGIFMLHS